MCFKYRDDGYPIDRLSFWPAGWLESLLTWSISRGVSASLEGRRRD